MRLAVASPVADVASLAFAEFGEPLPEEDGAELQAHKLIARIPAAAAFARERIGISSLLGYGFFACYWAEILGRVV
ncbi:MAG: hypothetical protein WAK91_05840 [Candidatus Acidiferrales bacterium]